MSVRGSKNKIIIYIAGACSIALAILLYHKASQKLESLEISYERCHLNEESLSAQLQVNLEYKIRLEKSLQQEKSDHAQTKEELQNKLENERQSRGRENSEAINKFSALQQQYKFLQSEHEVISLELNKLRQLRLSEADNKKHLEEVVYHLKKENELLMINNSKLKEENSRQLEKCKKAVDKMQDLEKNYVKFKTNYSIGTESEKLPVNKLDLGKGSRNVFDSGISPKDSVSVTFHGMKSSTPSNRYDRDFYPVANSIVANASTPMINPQAVQDDDKIQIAPVPQPGQESSSVKDQNYNYPKNENVGPKPEKMKVRNMNEQASVQGLLRARDIFSQFQHIPEILNYEKQLKEGEKNNHGGEVGDEDEPVIKNIHGDISHNRDGNVVGQSLSGHAVDNEIPRNIGYQYAAEDDRKEGEDDDDLDPLDYHNERRLDVKESDPKLIQIAMPFGEKRDGALIHQN